jgi:hypothetical protein
VLTGFELMFLSCLEAAWRGPRVDTNATPDTLEQ